MVEVTSPSLRVEKTPPPGGERPVASSGPPKVPLEELLVYKKRPELLKAIQEHDTVLLIAGTGTGKTRGATQIALEAIGPNGKMVMTENLRKATEDGAASVLADRKIKYPDEKMGDVIGFQNRYHREVKPDTRMLFCPIQTLLNKAENDPLLEKYDLIMVDEVHKESKQNEQLLATLKDIQKKRAELVKKGKGKPLKIILTSATMDEVKLTKYFPNAEPVKVEGTTFPIDEGKDMYLEKKVAMADLPLEAAKRVQFSIKKGDKGNMLVFLSGQAQIKQAEEALQEMMTKGEIDPNEFVVAPYLGSMSREEQNATFAKNSFHIGTRP